MTHQRIDCEGITTESGPYPSAVRAGRLVHVSGQVSFDDAGAVVAEGDVAGQTRQSLERLQRVLTSVGGSLEDVVACTVYLTDAAFAELFNEEWARWFRDRRPARATVVAQLLDPRLLVEVQATAVLRPQDAVGESRGGAP